ncbi:MAG: hypothetical protein COB29_07565 [Sulfitobacter sp.]|nr:MAG: hypothetical protein COB29_07565 [Sulfitobacter sp.]
MLRNSIGNNGQFGRALEILSLISRICVMGFAAHPAQITAGQADTMDIQAESLGGLAFCAGLSGA